MKYENLNVGSTDLEILLKRRNISLKLWLSANEIKNINDLNSVLIREDYRLTRNLFDSIISMLPKETTIETQPVLAIEEQPVSKKKSKPTLN